VTPTNSHLIGPDWIGGAGPALNSTSPSTGESNWQGHAATADEAANAVAAARAAFPKWAAFPLKERVRLLNALADQYRIAKEKIAEAVCRETGKPRWEALAEVDAMITKVSISIDAYNERCREQTRDLSGAKGGIQYRPHGVLVVLGPFNMPGHLPNGHIVPALLAGNTIVFKPSEQTPLVGQILAETILAAGFPPGVVNLLQGGPTTAIALAQHPDLNGLLFTGSTHAGKALAKTFANTPGKILALEMGGNNPLIVHEAVDLAAAVYLIIQSAFITAGQRCSCARRLIICHGKQGDALIEKLVESIKKLRVGLWTDQPEPFLGPVISKTAAKNLLTAQSQRITAGAIPLVEMQRDSRSSALLTPGLLDVTPLMFREDAELFGPLLQLIRVENFTAALQEANNTHYGLSAGLISDNAHLYHEFLSTVRAGVIHWNRPLTGASSHLPFGGINQSGNHRPSAYFAADYAAYPVATLESPKPQLPAQLPPGFV
jgi:succinylglutamic semialdehyde dehydrogenase